MTPNLLARRVTPVGGRKLHRWGTKEKQRWRRDKRRRHKLGEKRRTDLETCPFPTTSTGVTFKRRGPILHRLPIAYNATARQTRQQIVQSELSDTA